MLRADELDRLHTIKNELSELKLIGSGLAHRMNGIVHDNLTAQVNSIAARITELEFEMDKVLSSISDHVIQDADQNSRNVLSAALAGVELAERRQKGSN